MENTTQSFESFLLLQDHLHIRGEYSADEAEMVQDLGSPPHTWRILKSFISTRGTLRITSTYVENTSYEHIGLSVLWDHLHIRGEYKSN